MESEISSLVLRHSLNAREEQQFRLNLEDEDYATFILATARSARPHLSFVIKALLSRDPADIDIPIVGPTGITRTPIVHLSEYPYLVQLGVQAGAEPNQFCFFGPRSTNLIGLAAHAGSHEMATKLLALGADPNMAPPEDRAMLFSSPLEIAIRNQDRTMVEILLEHKANPNYVRGMIISSPLLAALEREDISLVHLLFFHGADWRKCEPRQVAILPFERFKWFVQDSGYSPFEPAEEGKSLVEVFRKLERYFDPGLYKAKLQLLLDAGAV